MMIEIKGESAVQIATAMMKDRTVFSLFGLDYRVSEVRTRHNNFSDVLFGEVVLFCLTKAKDLVPRVTTPSQGAAGRQVEHVDAPQPEDIGPPETVWVPWSDVVLGQSQHASSTDKEKGALLQVIVLTDEQQAKIDTYVRD